MFHVHHWGREEVIASAPPPMWPGGSTVDARDTVTAQRILFGVTTLGQRCRSCEFLRTWEVLGTVATTQ